MPRHRRFTFNERDSVADQIQTLSKAVPGPDGGSWTVPVQGEQSSGGTWTGWLEFTPAEGGSILRTDRDSTQPGGEYLASGLEEVCLEGAFERAVED